MPISSKKILLSGAWAVLCAVVAVCGWYLFLQDRDADLKMQTPHAILTEPFAEATVPSDLDPATRVVFEERIAGTKALYEESPEDVKTWVAIGNLYRSLKKPDLAIICYQKAIEIDGNNLLSYRNIAETYARDLSDYENAVTYYRLALTRDFADPSLYLSLGFLLDRNMQQPEAAEKVYLDGLPKTKYDRDVLLNLVELYKRMENEEKYKEYGTMLLDRYPNDDMIQEKYKLLVR